MAFAGPSPVTKLTYGMYAGTSVAHGVIGPQGLICVCPAPPSHPQVIGTHVADFTQEQATGDASSLMETVGGGGGVPSSGQFGDGVGPPPQQQSLAISPGTASDLAAALGAEPPASHEASGREEQGEPERAEEGSHQEPPVRDEEHGSATRR